MYKEKNGDETLSRHEITGKSAENFTVPNALIILLSQICQNSSKIWFNIAFHFKWFKNIAKIK